MSSYHVMVMLLVIASIAAISYAENATGGKFYGDETNTQAKFTIRAAYTIINKKLGWIPSEWEGREHILVSPAKLNMPTIGSCYASGVTLQNVPATVNVTYKGEIRATVEVTGTAPCKMNFFLCPFDWHTCNVCLSFDGMQNNLTMSISPDILVTSPAAWRVFSNLTTDGYLESLNENPSSQGFISYTLCRNATFLVWIMFIFPTFVAIVTIYHLPRYDLMAGVFGMLTIIVFAVTTKLTSTPQQDELPILYIHQVILVVIIGVASMVQSHCSMLDQVRAEEDAEEEKERDELRRRMERFQDQMDAYLRQRRLDARLSEIDVRLFEMGKAMRGEGRAEQYSREILPPYPPVYNAEPIVKKPKSCGRRFKSYWANKCPLELSLFFTVFFIVVTVVAIIAITLSSSSKQAAAEAAAEAAETLRLATTTANPLLPSGDL